MAKEVWSWVWANRRLSTKLAGCCNNALEAQEFLAARSVDLIFADINMPDLSGVEQAFKATIGASEVSLSGAGHLGQRTTYLFSARQSYQIGRAHV